MFVPPQERFDMVDCLYEYRCAVTIHGDDVLSHSNWEISESFLRQFGLAILSAMSAAQTNKVCRFLIDQKTLEVTNKWRRERGEPELRLADLSPAESTPAA